MHECPEELRKSTLFILNANGASLLLAGSFGGQGSSKQKGTVHKEARAGSRAARRAEGGSLHAAGGVPEGGRLRGCRPSRAPEGAHSWERLMRLPGERLHAQPSETSSRSALAPNSGLQRPLCLGWAKLGG